LSKGQDITITSFDTVAKNGNNVEAIFDSVERTIFYNNTVAVFGNKVECCFDIVAGVDGPLHLHIIFTNHSQILQNMSNVILIETSA